MARQASDSDAALSFQTTVVPSAQSDPIISVVLGDYHFAGLTSSGRVLSWGKYSSGALGLGDPRQLEVGAPGGFRRREEKEMAIEGRGNQPDGEVTVPTEVKWDWDPSAKGKKFCFAVTASGWHTGALAIDLDRGIGTSEAQGEGEQGEVEISDAEQFARWSREDEPYPQPQIDGPGGSQQQQPPGAYPGDQDDVSMYESPPFNPNNNGRGHAFPSPIRPMPGRRGRPIMPPGGPPHFRVGFAGRGGGPEPGRNA